jgi:hypothetical protein
MTLHSTHHMTAHSAQAVASLNVGRKHEPLSLGAEVSTGGTSGGGIPPARGASAQLAYAGGWLEGGDGGGAGGAEAATKFKGVAHISQKPRPPAFA